MITSLLVVSVLLLLLPASAASRRTQAITAGSECDFADAICFRDTAYAHTYPGDPGPIKDKWWIFFGAAGDSIEIRLRPAEAGSITTNVGVERDSQHNNVSYFHKRLNRDGVIEVWVVVDYADALGDMVPYTLSYRRIGQHAAGSLTPTGQRAILAVSSSSARDRFAVVPASVATAIRNATDWSVHAQTFNVALVTDSLYKVCKLPCSSAKTVGLAPLKKTPLRF